MYIEELYDNTRDAGVEDNGEEPPILATDVEDALQHMKKGKTLVDLF